MTTALRYITIGALCAASLVAAFSPPWYLTLIAFWGGMMLGFAYSLIVFAWDKVHDNE